VKNQEVICLQDSSLEDTLIFSKVLCFNIIDGMRGLFSRDEVMMKEDWPESARPLLGIRNGLDRPVR
jgi:hypothetical protein